MSDIEGIKKAVGVGYRKHITDYDTKLIAIPYAYVGNKQLVEHSTDELTAVCPVTGLPDFYCLNIRYLPNGHLVELKSLKMYLMKFRDVGILHEDLAQLILNDFVECTKPDRVEIELQVAPRGGIGTRVVAEYPTPKP